VVAVRVLVIGSGAREHALLLGLRKDPGVDYLAIAPGTLTLRGAPGSAVGGKIQVRNNTGSHLQTQVQRLPEVYADLRKHGRYVSNGFQPQVGDPWISTATPTFAMASGATQSLLWEGTIPAQADRGQRYEELAFLRGTADDGTVVMTLLRVQVVIEQPVLDDCSVGRGEEERAEKLVK
jgi:hypothetical protein